MQSKTQANGRQILAWRRVLLLLCSWGCGHAVRAQSVDSSADGPVRVHGIVVNAVTQAPISRALVTSADRRMALMTGDKGRFEFEVRGSASHPSVLRGLPGAGVAYITAKKPGYLVMGPPLPVLLSDQTALKTEVRLQLMPEATVYGLVKTPGADLPLGLNVQLLRKEVQDGAAVWMQVEAQEVNTRGRYRFGGLTPGDYKVVTAEWVDRIGPYPVTGGRPMLGYPPEAFPNGSSPATAGTIHLSGGQNVEADLNLRPAPYYSVEIPVVSSSRADAVVVAVDTESGPGYSLGFNGQTQRVEGALPEGIYHLTVSVNLGQSQPGQAPNILLGSAELTVAGKPVQGSPIRLLPGVTIPVAMREEFTGPDPDQQALALAIAPTGSTAGVDAAPPQAAQTVALQDSEGKVIQPPAVQVFLMPIEGRGNAFGIANSRQNEPGNEGLVLENVSPGSYRVQVNPRRGYPASVTANGVSLLRDQLVIAAGAATPTISIVLRDDTATITGTAPTDAANDVGSPFPHSVWAYPLGDEEAGRPCGAPEGADGKFTINDVVPGRYLVLASKAQSLNLEYRNRDVMKTYEPKGVIVNVSSRQTIKVELKESVTDDSWPETETVD